MKENIVRIVKLHLTQRRRRSLLINDTYPGIIIAVAGFSMLGGGQFNALALASIIAGIALVLFGVKEWRSSQEKESHGIQWVDVFGGVVTILDAMAMYKPWKGFQPASLYFAVGLAAIAKGMFNIKPRGFRRLTIFKDGFKIRTSPFSALKSKWGDVEILEFEESKIHVTAKNKVRRSLKLRGVENISEAIEVLKESARKNMVDVVGGGN
ncbi:MAG: hypothetical protein WBZ48_10755 [Bacteroidota bacterium]